MWREFFGKDARIIGVEFNPEAVKWREHGFEIYIGDQSDPSFWLNFFDKIGDIDVLLDDGGHRNNQQIITVKSVLPHVRDQGLIIIEDTQTSFIKFENFKRFSFVNFLIGKIQSLYARSDEVVIEPDIFTQLVHSIEFFTGICVLHINRSLCTATQRVENNGVKSNQSDFRHNTDAWFQRILRNAYNWISWDYPSVERKRKYPRISNLMQVSAVKKLSSVFILLLRSFIYLLLKLVNLKNLRKHW